MRAIAEDEFGGPVALMTLPIPEIGAGEVLIRVRVAGVNPFDWKVADGVLKDEKEHRFPLIRASTPRVCSRGSGADDRPRQRGSRKVRASSPSRGC
jgi:NADPH:quinone reductase-like Zn-dependent oxidoreductase